MTEHIKDNWLLKTIITVSISLLAGSIFGILGQNYILRTKEITQGEMKTWINRVEALERNVALGKAEVDANIQINMCAIKQLREDMLQIQGNINKRLDKFEDKMEKNQDILNTILQRLPKRGD